MRKRLIGLLLALVFVLLAACTPSGGGGPSSPGSGDTPTEPGNDSTTEPDENTEYRTEINIAFESDPRTFVPILWNSTSASRPGMLIFDGLVVLDQNVIPQPALATSWDQPDETTWVFHLREGVKFHDGRDFTAADVKYTYEAILNPEYSPPFLTRYNSIESIDIIDPHTVQFNLYEPFAPILVYMDLPIMPEGSMSDPGFAEAPIGTGVYMLTEYVLNSVVRLTAFDGYWGEKAVTPNINIHVIGDNSMRFAALQAGDIDFIHSPLVPTDLPAAESDPNLVLHRAASPGIVYLGLNVRHPVLADLAVRQAIAHMTDKSVIANNFYGGMDTPGVTPLQHFSWAWDSSLHDYPHNPDSAVAILEEAGWLLGSNGIREKDGQQLAFQLATNVDDSGRFMIVEYLQNVLGTIGMQVDVDVQEWAVFNDNRSAGRTDAWVVGWLNLWDPDRMFDFFHTTSPSNWGGFGSPHLDGLLELGRRSSDRAVRAAAYQEAAQIATDQVYYVVLLDQAYIAIHTANMENFELYPSGSIDYMRNVRIRR